MLVSLSVLACALYLLPLAAIVAVLRGALDDALDLAATIGVVFSGDVLGTPRADARVPRRRRGLRADGARPRRRARDRREAPAARRASLLARLGGPVRARTSRRSRVGAATAFAYSLYASSPRDLMWDREWHVPFTASLRGQRMPFVNVYDPHKAPSAITSRATSSPPRCSRCPWPRWAPHALLSFAHDLQFAIAGGVGALLLRALCAWPPAAAGLAAILPLLAGPMAFRATLPPYMGPFEGDSDFSNFSLSFRPHVTIATVVLLSLMAHVARLTRDRQAQRPRDWGARRCSCRSWRCSRSPTRSLRCSWA